MSARIRAAIEALPATGGVVDATRFTGDVTFDDTVVVGDGKPVELRLGTVTIRGRVVPFELRGMARLLGNGLTVITQVDGAKLKGIIRGYKLNRCEIANLTVDGNRAANPGVGSGIIVDAAEHCRIHHLVVQNTVGKVHPAISFTNSQSHNTVEYNEIRNAGTKIDYADGIYLAGFGNRVLYNRIDGITDFGIVCETCSGSVVQGNVITNSSAGIAVGTGIAESTSVGNVVNGNVIIGGDATHWGMISIYQAKGPRAVSTVVSSNVIREVTRGHAILVQGGDQVALSDNLISDVSLKFDESYGIMIVDSNEITVTGSSIRRTGSYGVGIANSTDVKIHDTTIIDSGRHIVTPGIGLDVLAKQSRRIMLTGLSIYDSAPDPAKKRMPYCIDFLQGGSTVGVLVDGNLFGDGSTRFGCREGNVRLQGATGVVPEPPASGGRRVTKPARP